MRTRSAEKTTSSFANVDFDASDSSTLRAPVRCRPKHSEASQLVARSSMQSCSPAETCAHRPPTTMCACRRDNAADGTNPASAAARRSSRERDQLRNNADEQRGVAYGVQRPPTVCLNRSGPACAQHVLEAPLTNMRLLVLGTLSPRSQQYQTTFYAESPLPRPSPLKFM